MCAVLVLVAGAARQVAAQAAAPEVTRTTLSGIYTTKQATRGKNIYAGMCRSCHTPSSHTGKTFELFWAGKTMADLYGFVAERMPKNDPGGMAPQDYADVIAYLLSMNVMPAGKIELPPDSSALAPIRIVLKKKAASRPAVTHQ